MAWFNFLNKLTAQKHHQKTPASADFEPKLPATRAFQDVQVQNATMIVNYKTDDNQELKPPMIIVGVIGQVLALKIDDIPDYDLIKISGLTTHFIKKYASITIFYQKKPGQPLWVLCYDADSGQQLLPPHFERGKLGAAFNIAAPKIDGFRLKEIAGNQVGTFTNAQQKVVFLYRHHNWETVSYATRYLIANDFCETFQTIDGKRLKLTLAKGSVWQTYTTVTLIDGRIWHCLGGSVWVLQSDKLTVAKTRPKRQLATPQSKLPSAIPLHHPAVIDYVPGEELTLYSRPFGKATGKLAHGTEVFVTARIRVDHMLWFKVNDVGWVLRQYLNLDAHPEYFTKK